MKSKVLGIMFAAVLAAGLLSGCGKENKKSETGAAETVTEQAVTANDSEEKIEPGDEESAAGFTDGGAQSDILDTSEPLSGIHHATIEVQQYGAIELELDADKAPITVTNFVKLAQEEFYDGLTFHRIIDGFMIQGGDPKGDGTGGSSETIKGEFEINGVKNEISHERGVISMARANDYDSASSQFFIMHADNDYLDGQYAAFGRVIDGMDVVDEICRDAVPTDNNGTIPKEDQPVIASIRIVD